MSGDTSVYEEYDHDGVGAMIKAGTVTNCIIRGASYGSNGRGRAAVNDEIETKNETNVKKPPH